MYTFISIFTFIYAFIYNCLFSASSIMWDTIQSGLGERASLILGTVLLVAIVPLLLQLYHVVKLLITLKNIGKYVDKIPGNPKHWLYGTLHLVCIVLHYAYLNVL